MNCNGVFVRLRCGDFAHCNGCCLQHACFMTSMSCAQNFVRTNSWESYTSNAGTTLHLYDGHFCTGEMLQRAIALFFHLQDVMAFVVCQVLWEGRNNLHHALACSIA